jgi:hypothetical protein
MVLVDLVEGAGTIPGKYTTNPTMAAPDLYLICFPKPVRYTIACIVSEPDRRLVAHAELFKNASIGSLSTLDSDIGTTDSSILSVQWRTSAGRVSDEYKFDIGDVFNTNNIVFVSKFDDMVESNFTASPLRGKVEFGAVIAKAILAGAYAHLLCSTIDFGGKAEISWDRGEFNSYISTTSEHSSNVSCCVESRASRRMPRHYSFREPKRRVCQRNAGRLFSSYDALLRDRPFQRSTQVWLFI